MQLCWLMLVLLTPSDIDQLITISGMVVRMSSLIPEMREGLSSATGKWMCLSLYFYRHLQLSSVALFVITQQLWQLTVEE